MRRKVFWIKGVDLPQVTKSKVRSRYPYRHTGDHTPNWALPSLPYWDRVGLWTHYFEAKPQFHSDFEWLEGCEFPMANAEGTEFAPCWYQPRRVSP